MAVVPLSPSMLYHFNVIYNHAKSSLSHTDDTSVSLDVTRWIVDSLENVGLVNSYYHDRDKRPNLNLAEELERVLSQSEVTILILTPGFVKNCFYQYTHINAFKKLLDYAPERLIVLQFGQTADGRIPAALWDQEIIYYNFDDYKLHASFWCKLYNRVGYVMSLGTFDLLHWRSLKNSYNGRAPIHEQWSSNAFVEAEYTFRDLPCDLDNINEHSSASPYVPERLIQRDPFIYTYHNQETGLNQLDTHDFTFDPPLSQSTDLSSFDLDTSNQENHEMYRHEYSTLLDDSMQTLSSRSQDSHTEDFTETESREAGINELQYYDPHKNKNNDNILTCINFLKQWPTLGNQFNGFRDKVYHVDSNSTRRKYQKNYEKLLYMDDRSSIQSDTDSLEQDETNVNTRLSEDICIFPHSRTHYDLEQDINEKLRCLEVDHEETISGELNVGNALLKELDAIDPDYGWQLHRKCDFDLFNEEIGVKKDETMPLAQSNHFISDHSVKDDQCFVESKPYVTAYLKNFSESYEMHCDKEFSMNKDARHTDNFLRPRQDSQATTLLQSHFHNTHLPALTDRDMTCPLFPIYPCNSNTTTDFADFDERNAVSLNVDCPMPKHNTNGSEIQAHSRVQTSTLNSCDSKMEDKLRQRCFCDSGGIFPSFEHISIKNHTLKYNAANSPIVERCSASQPNTLTDSGYFTLQANEGSSRIEFEKYSQSDELTTVKQTLMLNNESCLSLPLSNNLNLINRQSMHNKEEAVSEKPPYFDEKGVPYFQGDAKGRCYSRNLESIVHKENRDLNDVPIDARFTGLTNTSKISSMLFEAPWGLHQERVTTLVSLYSTDDLLQRYSYHKDLEKRRTKEQTPNLTKQGGNQIYETEGIENKPHDQDERGEGSEILNCSTSDGRKGNKRAQSGTNMANILVPHDLDEADIQVHKSITMCYDKDTHCFNTIDDNVIVQQNDTHTRENHFDINFEKNITKMADTASEEITKTEEGNVPHCGHSNSLPVTNGGHENRLDTNRAESQPHMDYVENFSNSPIEGNSMELLSSISAGSNAYSLTSSNKDFFRDRFLVMENRLNCLSHNINVVANAISSEVIVMQEANRCITHETAREQQLARSIQHDNDICCQSEKPQEKGNVKSTSVQCKVFTFSDDPISPGTVNESFMKATEDVQQGTGSDRESKINISDDHSLADTKVDNHRITTTEDSQTFIFKKENHQMPTVPNHHLIATAKIRWDAENKDDCINAKGTKGIHDTISTTENNQIWTLREYSDCCQGNVAEHIPQINETIKSHQIVSLNKCQQMHSAHTIYEKFKGNDELLWDGYQQCNGKSMLIKLNPKCTFVQTNNTENTFLLSFASFATEVASGFDYNNIVAHILSEQITKDHRVESKDNLNPNFESHSAPRSTKEKDATILYGIPSSCFLDPCDSQPQANEHYFSDYLKETDIASKSDLKSPFENCSKDNGENLHGTSASVQNDFMISVEDGNMAGQNIKRQSLVESNARIPNETSSLKTHLEGSMEDADKSSSETLSFRDSNHKQEPNRIDNKRNLSSEFSQCAVPSPYECDKENDNYHHAKTQAEDFSLIKDGLIIQNKEHVLDDYAENKNKDNSSDEPHMDGSSLLRTGLGSRNEQSMENQTESKFNQSDSCLSVIQRDQTSIAQTKCSGQPRETDSRQELYISPKEGCLHEGQENQELCKTKLNSSERPSSITLTSEKNTDDKNFANVEIDKCVIASVSTALNIPHAFNVYDYRQLDCPGFVKKNSLEDFLVHPQWDEAILNTPLLHATSQSSERKLVNEELKSKPSLGYENPVTKSNENCSGPHKHSISRASRELKADVKEWTEAQMMRKKRRGTNVDGLSSSPSSSSSEEEQNEWVMSVYKGLCHGYSHPDMPFIG